MTDLTVPWIRSGVGPTPADGGCVMQMADWITRNEWTDHPPCVHPVITECAIAVNDRLDDTERQELLALIPRMLDTAGGDEALTRKLLAYLAREVYPIYEAWRAEFDYDDGGQIAACIAAAEQGEAWASADAAGAAGAADAADAAGAAGAADAANAAWAAGAADAAGAAPTPSLLSLLIGLLDRYDELTGRTETPEVDLTPVCEVMAS